jgi:hypothetical protein
MPKVILIVIVWIILQGDVRKLFVNDITICIVCMLLYIVICGILAVNTPIKNKPLLIVYIGFI